MSSPTVDVPHVCCPICKTAATLVEDSYPGYRDPTTYGIATCSACTLSFAHPTTTDTPLYDAIYRQRAVIPGYDRYDRYARHIERAHDPLTFLAEQEENYWAVRQAVRSLPADAEILDVGSGLGYLTYALARAGYRATGIDHSRTAVDSARARFGEHYAAADFFRWADENSGRYDLVVMLELIEHVEHPLTWLRAALRLIKPGGNVLLSTPNRDFYPSGTVWETEAPPVHLWWFSVHAMKRFAAELGVEVQIVDLRACPVAPPSQPNGIIRTVRSPMLLQNGRSVSWLRRLFHRLGMLDFALAVYGRLARKPKIESTARETLVAIFRVPAAPGM